METEEDIKKIIIDILKSSQTTNEDKEFSGSLLYLENASRYNHTSMVRQKTERYKKYFNEALALDFDVVLSIIKDNRYLFEAFCISNSDIIISKLKGEQ